MSRISATFDELRQRHEGALIAFFTVGDPRLELTPRLVKVLSKHADIVELGIPFSDPIADGPTIQEGIDRALKASTTPHKALNVIKKIRRNCKVPLIVLTYYNILLKPGLENFIKRFASAGMDGIIVPDLPLEESGELLKVAKKYGVDLVLLVTPTTNDERLGLICQASSGFVYVVSLFGVTGAREKLSEHVRPLIARVKKISSLPIAVGFGISRAEHVAAVMSADADGAIVGSAFVNIVKNNLKNEKKMLREIETFARALKVSTRKR